MLIVGTELLNQDNESSELTDDFITSEPVRDSDDTRDVDVLEVDTEDVVSAANTSGMLTFSYCRLYICVLCIG